MAHVLSDANSLNQVLALVALKDKGVLASNSGQLQKNFGENVDILDYK